MADESHKHDAATAAAAAAAADPETPELPTVCIVIGMAGSGKSTLMQRLNAHMHERKTRKYILNLDPAVLETTFGANIDIRDTVNYKEVMRQYKLGPNGGILTSLNLFATRLDQVMEILAERTSTAPGLEYVFLDTPGQIEIFTWSASGAIITEALSAAYPTVVLYVVDTPRTTAPATFMSNMLYACSILYKTRLPFVLVFNKTDHTDHSFAIEWMQNYEVFAAALTEQRSMASDLVHSMALVLDEFYSHLVTVGVSAVTGEGIDELFEKIGEARERYFSVYKAAIDEATRAREAERARAHADEMERVRRDMAAEPTGAAVDRPVTVRGGAAAPSSDTTA